MDKEIHLNQLKDSLEEISDNDRKINFPVNSQDCGIREQVAYTEVTRTIPEVHVGHSNHDYKESELYMHPQNENLKHPPSHSSSNYQFAQNYPNQSYSSSLRADYPYQNRNSMRLAPTPHSPRPRHSPIENANFHRIPYGRRESAVSSNYDFYGYAIPSNRSSASSVSSQYLVQGGPISYVNRPQLYGNQPCRVLHQHPGPSSRNGPYYSRECLPHSSSTHHLQNRPVFYDDLHSTQPLYSHINAPLLPVNQELYYPINPPHIMLQNPTHTENQRLPAGDDRTNPKTDDSSSMQSGHSRVTETLTKTKVSKTENSQIKSSGEILIPHENLEAYRQEVKKSNDPVKQFEFAKQLILVAEEMRKNPLGLDPAKVRKNRDILHSESVRWMKKAASCSYKGKTGLPDALFFLADCYGNGNLGLTINHDRAFGYYVQGAKHDHPASIYRTGVCYEVGAGPRKDPGRAVQYYKKAAALGDTAAMYKLGIVLLAGSLGQTRNPREGVTYLKRAANQADETTPFALHELAGLYEGTNPDPTIGVVPDPSYAYELYVKSAKLGYAPSQYKLGLSFEFGHLNLPIDPARSIAWYSKAAKQGDPDSELALSGWYLTGCEAILARNGEEAFLWAQKAAEKGHAKAEYALAYYFEYGIGTSVDLKEARRWYVRAASQGNARAIARLKGNQAQLAHNLPSQWMRNEKAREENCSLM